jgi:hypothetical protein
MACLIASECSLGKFGATCSPHRQMKVNRTRKECPHSIGKIRRIEIICHSPVKLIDYAYPGESTFQTPPSDQYATIAITRIASGAREDRIKSKSRAQAGSFMLNSRRRSLAEQGRNRFVIHTGCNSYRVSPTCMQSQYRVAPDISPR